VRVSAWPPGGFDFIQWFQTYGGGVLDSALDSDTVFTMGQSDSTIVATSAKLESWFSPGPETNATGLLLPKPTTGVATRVEERLRVTLHRGISAEPPYSRIWNALAVRIKWQAATYERFFTAENGGVEIRTPTLLLKSVFRLQQENTYEGSLWYQGNLTQTQIAKLTLNGQKLQVTIDVNFMVAGNDRPPSWTGNLLPIDIKEVASDQINDNECNKLPTAKFADEPNNPMLMATRSGVRAHLAIKVNSPEGLRDKVYVGARKVGAAAILGSVKVKAPNEKIKLEFDALPGHEIYEVVAGYDQNGNASLDNDEAKIVFKKTPAGSATSGLQYLDKIIIVTESQFGASKGTVAGYNVWGTGYAGHLIEGFALLNEKGFPSSQRLYVGDARSGQYRVFAGDEHLHNYQVWAVDWVENGTVLRVLQDHGETGGHMKLKQVRLK